MTSDALSEIGIEIKCKPDARVTLVKDVAAPLAREDDVYGNWKALQGAIEWIDVKVNKTVWCFFFIRENIQTDLLKVETKLLERERARARQELERVQSVPLLVGRFV